MKRNLLSEAMMGAVLGLALVSGGCGTNPIIGCYAWRCGMVSVTADGKMQKKLCVGDYDSGTWVETGANTYTFTWASGFIDGITLTNGVLDQKNIATPSGPTDNGTSQEPTEVCPDPIVGCYAWSCGTLHVTAAGTVTKSNCSTDSDTATWTSTGKGTYRFQWASGFVDSITLSGDSLKQANLATPAGPSNGSSSIAAPSGC